LIHWPGRKYIDITCRYLLRPLCLFMFRTDTNFNSYYSKSKLSINSKLLQTDGRLLREAEKSFCTILHSLRLIPTPQMAFSVSLPCRTRGGRYFPTSLYGQSLLTQIPELQARIAIVQIHSIAKLFIIS